MDVKQRVAEALFVLRAMAQAATFVLLANAFPVSDLATYVVIAAVAVIASTLGLCSLDLALIVTQDGQPSRRAELLKAWGLNSVLIGAVSMAAAAAVSGIAGKGLLVVTFFFLLGESALNAAATHSYRQDVARGAIVTGSVALSLPAIIRLGWSSLPLFHLIPPNLTTALWIWAMGAMAFTSLAIGRMLQKADPRTTGHSITANSLLQQGAGMTAAISLRTVSLELPKLAIAFFGSEAATATFGLAARLQQVGALPVQALLGNRLSRIIRDPSFAGQHRQLLLASSLGTAMVVVGGAVAPLLLPGEYEGVSQTAWILSLSVLPSAYTALTLDGITYRLGNRTRLAAATALLLVTVPVIGSVSPTGSPTGLALSVVAAAILGLFVTMRFRER